MNNNILIGLCLTGWSVAAGVTFRYIRRKRVVKKAATELQEVLKQLICEYLKEHPELESDPRWKKIKEEL